MRWTMMLAAACTSANPLYDPSGNIDAAALDAVPDAPAAADAMDVAVDSGVGVDVGVDAEECGPCGDGVCSEAETSAACYVDCGDTCGDGSCTGSEGPGSCAADCAACTATPCEDLPAAACPGVCGTTCGDGVCYLVWGESAESCPEDCNCP